MFGNFGPWQDALIDISEDADLSELVDLGGVFDHVLVLIPTIDSATVTPHIAKEDEEDVTPTTFYPVHALDDDATGSFAHATSAGTGDIAVIFRIGSARYIKIKTGANQTTGDVTFKCRGLNLGGK